MGSWAWKGKSYIANAEVTPPFGASYQLCFFFGGKIIDFLCWTFWNPLENDHMTIAGWKSTNWINWRCISSLKIQTFSSQSSYFPGVFESWFMITYPYNVRVGFIPQTYPMHSQMGFSPAGKVDPQWWKAGRKAGPAKQRKCCDTRCDKNGRKWWVGVVDCCCCCCCCSWMSFSLNDLQMTRIGQNDPLFL